jgi:hypothetical protein
MRPILSGAVMGVFFLVPSAFARDHCDHWQKYSEVYMPVSLAPGRVRTPEFAVISEAYFIEIRAENRLPFIDMKCMMGLISGPWDQQECNMADIQPVLKADWKVWDGDRVVAQGSNPNDCACEFTNEFRLRIFGPFIGEAGRKYVVEMHLTADGSPLDVTNPHLIVIRVRYH